MAMAPEQMGIGIRRYFTEAGRIRTTRSSGSTARPASPTTATAPTPSSSPTSSSRSAGRRTRRTSSPRSTSGTLGTPERESSLRAGHRPDRRHHHRLGHPRRLLRRRRRGRDLPRRAQVRPRAPSAAFNSPVWFNIGVRGVRSRPARASSSPSTTRWTRSSTGTGKRGSSSRGGSGSGDQPLGLRSSEGRLQGGGTASGPGELHARRRRARPERSSRVGRPGAPPRW